VIVHIQYRRRVPATEGCYVAWQALEQRGWEVRPFEHLDQVVVDPDQPVVGGLDNVVNALRLLGVEPPEIGYPHALRPFLLDPDVATRTVGWVRQHTEEWPVFVKPTTGHKEFTGFVVRHAADLQSIATAPDDVPVFIARPVDLRLRTEWRAFVIGGEVRDIRPYSARPDGDAPAVTFVQMLASQWSTIPAGCSIDVVNLGTRGTPDWRVVECNDGYALSSYGLFAITYAELLVKRWFELTSSGIGWPV
jgi:hypothetical protein